VCIVFSVFLTCIDASLGLRWRRDTRVQPFLPQVHGSQYGTSTPFSPHLHATLGLRSLIFRRLSALSDSDSKHEPIDTRRYSSKYASLLAHVSRQSPPVHLTEHETRLLGRVIPASTCQSHQTNQSGALRPTVATSSEPNPSG
jgi:hypothetical protein